MQTKKHCRFDSAEFLAERVGFEPTVRCRTIDFESNTIDLSDTSPLLICQSLEKPVISTVLLYS